MKVLLVAPRTGLLYADDEVQRVLRSGLDVTPVLGTVTQTVMLDEVTVEGYDVLWLCTHGTSDGVLLSDGLLSSATLAQMVRSRFSLVVLNTCDSIQTAQLIQNETNAEIVATIIEVPDREAFQTGVLFARALSQTQDIAAAYNIARPVANRSYIRLASNERARVSRGEFNRELSMVVEESLRAEIRELRSALGTLSTTVNNLSLTLTGDREIVQRQIMAFDKQANARIDTVERLITKMAEMAAEPNTSISQEAINRLFYAVCGLGVILIVIAWLIANGGGT